MPPMKTPSALRNGLAFLSVSACLLGCTVPSGGSPDDPSEGDPGTTGTSEQALKTALPGGCSLDAIPPFQGNGTNTGEALLRCSYTTNRHEVSVVIEQCNFGSCVTLPKSAHRTVVPGMWGGARVYLSRSVPYTSNTVYRTRACATVFAPSGALLGSACNISAAVAA